MTATVLQALTRHLLTALGGAFATRFGLDGDSLDAAIGAVSLLVGTAWSVYDKKRRGE